MKIRSITYFVNPGYPINHKEIQRGGRFINAAREAYSSSGLNVQTSRLATVPFPELLPGMIQEKSVSFAQELEDLAQAEGFDYVSIGSAIPSLPESYKIIPEILGETEKVFASGIIATKENGISLPAIRECAEIIREISTIDPKGFGNLYFAALANVPAGVPFFPAAYHSGERPAFALAIEAADLAVQALSGVTGIAEASARLVEAIEINAQKMTRISKALERKAGIRFLGIDFSLAPYPESESSLGTAMEALGVPAVGLHGSLMAAAFLTGAIDKAKFLKAGFNGLMLPLLEDAALAKRAYEGTLSVKDLLMYSAVCGTGLDTVPLPGATTPKQIEAVLLDLSVLALRLDKPLTARLMPIPGKMAGDTTDFNFSYFANTRVLGLSAEPLQGLLQSDESIRIEKR